MGVIYGNDGSSYRKFGGSTYRHGADGDDDTIRHYGSSAYCRDGARHDCGGSSYGSGGTIRQSSDTYFTDGGTYRHIGNSLFGPNGKVWHGDMSDEDIRDIISHDDN